MMKVRMQAGRLLTLSAVVMMVLLKPATAPAQDDPAQAVKQVLLQQVEAWNLGDIDAFMQGYNNAPDTTFVGKSIERGYAPILERYKKAYANKEAMGTLEFSEIEVRRLDPQEAIATGRYHLTRTAASGGDATGIFYLAFEKTPEGWKIVLDYTTSLTP
jgi:uncharacterized protein (TIGR02246 family)